MTTELVYIARERKGATWVSVLGSPSSRSRQARLTRGHAPIRGLPSLRWVLKVVVSRALNRHRQADVSSVSGMLVRCPCTV